MKQNLTAIERVYDFILRSGAAGVTDRDIFEGLGQSSHIRNDRKRRERLEECEFIEYTGMRRTESNRLASVYKATVVVRKLENNLKRKKR